VLEDWLVFHREVLYFDTIRGAPWPDALRNLSRVHFICGDKQRQDKWDDFQHWISLKKPGGAKYERHAGHRLKYFGKNVEQPYWYCEDCKEDIPEHAVPLSDRQRYGRP
jgi:hypothetical protein